MGKVLKTAVEPCMKTHIIYRANLSFAQLNRYLSFCLEHKLLKKQIKGSRVVYATTKKGRKFLDAFEKAKSLVGVKEERELY